MEIVRIVEEKQEEEEDLIEIRIVEEMVPGRFHKYLEVFEKKGVRKNANKKAIGLYHRSQKEICYKKGEDISVI